MSTADQILSSALHGEALVAARRDQSCVPSLITLLSKRKAGMTSEPSALASSLVPGSPILLGKGKI
jgi:hypothetical protein